MIISSLHLYPVKSLGGVSVTSIEVDSLGPLWDRRFMVIDGSTSRFMSQRNTPRMALISTSISGSSLQLTAPSGTSISVTHSGSDLPSHNATVWNDEVSVADCGDDAASFLSDALQKSCRLVRVGSNYRRPIRTISTQARNSPLAPRDVGFADAFPILIVSETSLASLNDRLMEKGEDAVPMNRFRPNIVVSGCPAFAEDTWFRYRAGSLVFRNTGPCARCTVVTTDQTSGAQSKEPLQTLAQFRRDPADSGKVNFGQNALVETFSGSCSVGDSISLL